MRQTILATRIRPRAATRCALTLLGVLAVAIACDSSSDKKSPPENRVDAESPQTMSASVDWSAHGELAYVTNEDSGNVSIISVVTNTVVKTLDVGRRPRGIKVTPEGDKVFVALSGSPKCPPSMSDEDCERQTTDKSADGIAMIDVMSATLERVLPGGSDPEQFDLSANGTQLIVSNEDSDQATIVDVANGEILQTIEVGREPEGVRVSPNGELAYVTGESDHDITVLNTTTGEVISTFKVGLRPRDVIFSPDGSLAYASAELGHSVVVIDAIEHKVISTIELDAGDKPMGMVITSDGKCLYIANGRGRTVSEIDLETNQVRRSVEVGPRVWGIAMTSDEKFLYTANGSSDDVTVVNTATMQVVTKISVGESPWGIVIGPNPTTLRN